MRASESSQRRESALLRWLQSHFGTSTTVHVHRILADPNADIKHRSAKTPPERGPASNMCAARAVQDGQRRSCTIRHLAARKNSSACSYAGLERSPPPSFRTFHRSIRGSRAVVAQSDIRLCHAEPTTCAAPITQPPAILPPGKCCEVLRCDARTSL
jgi:hypothetical protein